MLLKWGRIAFSICHVIPSLIYSVYELDAYDIIGSIKLTKSGISPEVTGSTLNTCGFKENTLLFAWYITAIETVRSQDTLSNEVKFIYFFSTKQLSLLPRTWVDVAFQYRR